eukprot:1856373-Amphidinium_carterae.1
MDESECGVSYWVLPCNTENPKLRRFIQKINCQVESERKRNETLQYITMSAHCSAGVTWIVEVNVFYPT